VATARYENNKVARQREFGQVKQWQMLTEREACRKYMLSSRDLKATGHVLKKMGTFAEPDSDTKLFTHFDVQDACLERYGNQGALQVAIDEREKRKVRRINRLEQKATYYKLPQLRSAHGFESKNGHNHTGAKALGFALLGNTVVATAKFGAWICTGSGSMLSEAVHSFADVTNQSLLAVGMYRARSSGDTLHPYGYGFEQYVFALISGVGVFFLGCGISIYHGIHCLMHPEPLMQPGLALGVLGFAGILEGYTCLVAWREIKREAFLLSMTPMEYLQRGPDPINVAVFLEDAVAVVGVGLAACCISMTYITGSPVYDAMGSILIGTMLGGVAVFTINKNRAMLGQCTPEQTDAVVQLLLADPVVMSVQDVKAVMVGPKAARFKAELQLNPYVLTDKYLSTADNLEAIHNNFQKIETPEDTRKVCMTYSRFLVATLATEVDRLEALIRSRHPEFRHIDLELL
jgi:zinc transporter 9